MNLPAQDHKPGCEEKPPVPPHAAPRRTSLNVVFHLRTRHEKIVDALDFVVVAVAVVTAAVVVVVVVVVVAAAVVAVVVVALSRRS